MPPNFDESEYPPLDPQEIFENLALRDIRDAADLLGDAFAAHVLEQPFAPLCEFGRGDAGAGRSRPNDR